MKEQPTLLLIETATEICSVALSFGDDIIAVQEGNDGNSHSKNLIPYIDAALKQGHKSLQDLDAVVVSIGPGSYTGLRIGVSTAKGIAYSLSIPVITVSSLESIANGAKHCWQPENDAQPQIVPMIDARRMEVFTTRFDYNINILDPITATIVEENTYAELCKNQKIIFCGNGMPKCKEILSRYPNAICCEFALSAQFLLPSALKKWQSQDFADIAYFEPFYLKDYVAAKPNVKGLH